MSDTSFGRWLSLRLLDPLRNTASGRTLLFWCDPDRQWKEILKKLCSGESIELWADEEHELALREKLAARAPGPLVVWLPAGQDDLTYLAVVLPDANAFTASLSQTLVDYGVDLAPAQRAQVEPYLKTHVVEWLDKPLSAWSELTPGTAAKTLVDDDVILAGLAGTLEKPLDEERLPVFRRRVTQDFGLPEPCDASLDDWRLEAMATLLVSEAAELCSEAPPPDAARTIPSPLRQEALKLLKRLKGDIDLVARFEQLAVKAEVRTDLGQWAAGFDSLPPPLSARAAEEMLFAREVNHLAQTGPANALVKHLSDRLAAYQQHARAFWGQRASKPVPWGRLAAMAGAASEIAEAAETATGWASPADAICWYTRSGAAADEASETLFAEDPDLPEALAGPRMILCQLYQRLLDASNVGFAELIAQQGLESTGLSPAGRAIDELVAGASAKNPVAVMMPDALRYELGIRLAQSINRGEPSTRAELSAALAGLPSVTDVGMALALPGLPDGIAVGVGTNHLTVTLTGSDCDLGTAAGRREWIKQRYGLDDAAFVDVDFVLDPSSFRRQGRRALRLLFVTDRDLDEKGHRDQLAIQGARYEIERYRRCVLALREAGYRTVAVVTDHGFFTWNPASDEIEAKPKGEVLWDCRRAVVGRSLASATSLRFALPGGALECMTPRSVNAYRTYGGLGYFHGGATLQEIVLPVLIVRWPRKVHKIGGVIKPIEAITSLAPRIQVQPVGEALAIDPDTVSRRVHVQVVDPKTLKVYFKTREPVPFEPDGELAEVILERKSPPAFGAKLEVRLVDAEDEEVLDRRSVVVKVAADEWD